MVVKTKDYLRHFYMPCSSGTIDSLLGKFLMQYAALLRIPEKSLLGKFVAVQCAYTLQQPKNI
jgi:hypothetical protein